MEKENGPGATENGTAIFKFHLKGNDPAGQWQAQAIANQIGVTGSNMTTFTGHGAVEWRLRHSGLAGEHKQKEKRGAGTSPPPRFGPPV